MKRYPVIQFEECRFLLYAIERFRVIRFVHIENQLMQIWGRTRCFVYALSERTVSSVDQIENVIDQKIVDHFAVFPNVCKKYRFYNAECRIIGCRCEKECSPSVFGYGRVAAVCNFYRVEIVRGVNPHRGRKQ